MAEIKATISLDSTRFTQGLTSAENKLGRFAAKMGGASDAFGSFNSVFSGFTDIMRDAELSGEKLGLALGRAALAAGGMAAAVLALGEIKKAIGEVQDEWDKLDLVKPGAAEVLGRSFVKVIAMVKGKIQGDAAGVDAAADKLNEMLFGAPKVDKEKSAKRIAAEREKIIAAAMRGTKPITIEERLRGAATQGATVEQLGEMAKLLVAEQTAAEAWNKTQKGFDDANIAATESAIKEEENSRIKLEKRLAELSAEIAKQEESNQFDLLSTDKQREWLARKIEIANVRAAEAWEEGMSEQQMEALLEAEQLTGQMQKLKQEKTPDVRQDADANEWARIGLFAGGVASAAIDYARQTADYTGQMVAFMRNGLKIQQLQSGVARAG